MSNSTSQTTPIKLFPTGYQ